METKSYVVTKEECEKKIKGVCEGCGGKLSALETEDNSGNPTYWVGCEECNCFRGGIEKIYWEIARKMILEKNIIPYHSLDMKECGEKYYLQAQTAGLSFEIKNICLLYSKLKEMEGGNESSKMPNM